MFLIDLKISSGFSIFLDFKWISNFEVASSKFQVGGGEGKKKFEAICECGRRGVCIWLSEPVRS